MDRLTSTALPLAPNGVVGFAGDNTSEKKKAVPSCAKVTHGSDARGALPSAHLVTPVGKMLFVTSGNSTDGKGSGVHAFTLP